MLLVVFFSNGTARWEGYDRKGVEEMGRCGKYEAEKAEKQQKEITSQWNQTCWENWVTVKVVGLRVKIFDKIFLTISQGE